MPLLKLEDPDETLWRDAITLSERLGLARRQSKTKDVGATRARFFVTWCPKLLDPANWSLWVLSVQKPEAILSIRVNGSFRN